MHCLLLWIQPAGCSRVPEAPHLMVKLLGTTNPSQWFSSLSTSLGRVLREEPELSDDDWANLNVEVLPETRRQQDCGPICGIVENLPQEPGLWVSHLQGFLWPVSAHPRERICWGKVSLREFQHFHQGRKPRGRTSSDQCRRNTTVQRFPRGTWLVQEYLETNHWEIVLDSIAGLERLLSFYSSIIKKPKISIHHWVSGLPDSRSWSYLAPISLL